MTIPLLVQQLCKHILQEESICVLQIMILRLNIPRMKRYNSSDDSLIASLLTEEIYNKLASYQKNR